ncbi:MAG: hypothetical protein ACT4PE_02425 [Candidatus Eiseniibacteriota bacterium]
MTTIPFRKRILPVFLTVVLAGCDDDTIVFVEDRPPAVPTGVTTITGDGRVDVLWNPVREDDVAGYGVYKNDTLEGDYSRIATIHDPETTSYVDFDVTNGVTYYYAVDAFDHEGHESALSYEAAFDTPRPAGSGTNVVEGQGIDFSEWDSSGFVTSSSSADVVLLDLGGVLHARGTLINGFWNDIQDLGWTASLDDVSWAPAEGWSVSPNGVELILGHTYVVWTHDSYFAKFRVTSLTIVPGAPPSSITVEWAYQIDHNNPELSPGLAPGQAVAPDGGVS